MQQFISNKSIPAFTPATENESALSDAGNRSSDRSSFCQSRVPRAKPCVLGRTVGLIGNPVLVIESAGQRGFTMYQK